MSKSDEPLSEGVAEFVLLGAIAVGCGTAMAVEPLLGSGFALITAPFGMVLGAYLLLKIVFWKVPTMAKQQVFVVLYEMPNNPCQLVGLRSTEDGASNLIKEFVEATSDEDERRSRTNNTWYELSLLDGALRPSMGGKVYG